MVPDGRPRSGPAAASARRSVDCRYLDRAASGGNAVAPRRRFARENRRPAVRDGASLMPQNLGPSASPGPWRGLLAADPGSDFDAGPPPVAFEFCPPRTMEREARLWEVVKRLEPLAPRFVSVTYGAGGSTRARTHATVTRILRETALVPAAHLTCVGASWAEVDEVARQYWEGGVRHIVALRGDPPPGTAYTPHPEGYPFAVDL